MPAFRNHPAGRVCHKIELTGLKPRWRAGPAPRALPPRPAQALLDESGLRVEFERLVAEHVSSLPAAEGVDSRQLEILQRRLSKVTEALVGREREIEGLRRALESDPGLASIYEGVQGLDPQDEGADQREGLMTEIFLSNLKLKERLTLNRPPAE